MSTKTKPITPYARLLKQFREWANKVICRETHALWTYSKSDLNLNAKWHLSTLYERVAAAEQLGYDVQLFATDAGLEVRYVKKLPKRPWNV